MNGKGMVAKQYILITPCKNEGVNLPKVIEGVSAQSILPSIWLIIDDGSTDNTFQIIEDAKSQYSWIEVLRLDEAPRDLGLHLAKVMKKGFDCVISICDNRDINYSYLGNLDGDIILPPFYYEGLVSKLEDNLKLGIVSGNTEYTVGDKKVLSKLRSTEPSGGHMLIRKSCFDDCGGVMISHSVDSILKAKARLRGWQTQRFSEYIATELRDVSSAEGYWKGLIKTGESFYYLNFHPFNAFIRSVKYSFRKPYYGAFPFMVGYFRGIIKNKQIEDEELRSYFWNKWKSVLFQMRS